MLRSLLSRFTDLTHGKRIVFLAINKTGSSSLWTWMDEQGVPYLMNRYREDEARKLRIIAEVKRKGLPCFTVVRNPWAAPCRAGNGACRKGARALRLRGVPASSAREHDRRAALPHAAAWRHSLTSKAASTTSPRRAAREHRCHPRWLADTLGLRVPVRCRTSRRAAAPTSRRYTPATRALVAEAFRRDFGCSATRRV